MPHRCASDTLDAHQRMTGSHNGVVRWSRRFWQGADRTREEDTVLTGENAKAQGDSGGVGTGYSWYRHESHSLASCYATHQIRTLP